MRALAGGFLATLIIAVGSGCGTGGPTEGGNTSNGKKLFLTVGKCGSCHELKDAGSRGQIGPNLDDAFRQVKSESYEDSGIENVVLDQIRFPREGSVMPADLVEGSDAEDVAAYVAQCAAADPNDAQEKLECPGIVAGTGGRGPLCVPRLPRLPFDRRLGLERTTLKGVFNSMVPLANGQTVKADEQYLLESILDADKQIVKGYQPGVMTAVVPKGSVPQEQAQQLVDYIKTLK